MTRLLQTRRAALGLSLGVLLALGYVDYRTAFELDLFLFYALPVAITAWWVGRVPAVLIALGSVVVWFGAKVVGAHPYSSRFYEYWNTGLRCGWVLIVALTISRIRADLSQEQQLNAALLEALGQVKQLAGLVPICVRCKSIRNDKGYWQQVEEYLRTHPDALFIHRICPACEEELRKAHSGETPARSPGSEKHSQRARRCDPAPHGSSRGRGGKDPRSH